MQRRDWTLMTMTAALVLLCVWVVGETPAALGKDAADSNSSMIAVTGEFGNGTSVLYLIDTESRNMAVYRSMSGSSVELVAARNVDFDLKLESYNDKTDPDYHPTRLKEQFSRFATKKKVPAKPADKKD